MARLKYELTCDRCSKVGVTCYTDKPEMRTAVQPHLCDGVKRPTWRMLKHHGD